ncbi:type VI secretion system tip protein VgrG [Herbaspirillum sp. WGmk3]|uniref:type VI secretion system Vgr family protein n=1 Tax=Herbaspirillum sp. WGmk3 TaxID=2919925 RepID=UPI002090A5C6|nr:type VI secretion system Vgr family protein [Herbaspirillum sp. WGmk3]MCO4855740.1 type VI secretion system tip protein VgrG [Herbaspirillum sp. WGmk3]
MSLFDSLLRQPQSRRLLRLSFPHDDAPACALVINRFEGSEAMSRDFRFVLELLSDEAAIPLTCLLGKLLCVSLVTADGSLRPFTGHVMSFRFVRTDGGIAFYEAVLVPWLHYAHLRRNCRLFHDQTIEQQTESILRDYAGLAHWRWQVSEEEVPSSLCTQWEETDHNYLARRWEAEGYCYWYEHTAQGHTLVICDDSTRAEAIEGSSADIRFHSAGGAEDEDAIAQWQVVQQGTTAQVAVSGFDFKQPSPRHVEIMTVVEQGEIARKEIHQYTGHDGFRTFLEGDRLARRRMEEIEAGSLLFEAQGNHRQVAPGRRFRLLEHFHAKAGDPQFVILEVVHEASNNYLQDADVPASYANRLRCLPWDTLWRPGPGFDSQSTTLLALQTATVVGPEGQGSLHVDAYGRIQVRFHWDRARSGSCWIRVATHWAGAHSGWSSHPRVGSEVVVQWLDGNPDHPLVTGCVHNQDNMPPWELPQQRALSGLRSRELTPEGGNAAGGRSNHVILDDSCERMQVQIRSDHLASQLSLGHLTRIEGQAGRKEARGEGFELRSDGHGALRAQRGLLLTTHACAEAEGQLTAMEETTADLQRGGQWQAELAQAAVQAGAQMAGEQENVAQILQQQCAAIAGQTKGAVLEEGVPAFLAPHLVLASPAGIETATAGSTHLLSQQHTAISSGGHASLSAGKSLLVSVREAVRLFACKAGMKLVAAAGDIDVSALAASVNILARLNITQTANRISIEAKEEVVINGGGSVMRWHAGGIEQSTSGQWRAHAAGYAHDGPVNGPVPVLPDPPALGELKQQRRLALVLTSHAVQGKVFAHEPYQLFKAGNRVAEGVTDAHGQVLITVTDEETASYEVRLSNGHVFELPVRARLDDMDAQLAARGYRAREDDARDRERNRAMREG